MNWIKIATLSIIVFLGLTLLHETLLSKAKHHATLTADSDLFCMQYSKIPTLDEKDVLLLGASRMQTDFDLDVFKVRFPERDILQLAVAGSGTYIPLFQNIVEQTNFSGVMLVSMAELNIFIEDSSQQEMVDYCAKSFTLDKKTNRLIRNWFQGRFISHYKQGSSYRLWTHLLGKGSLPQAFHNKTRADRSRFSDFELYNPKVLEELKNKKIENAKEAPNKHNINPKEWFSKAEIYASLTKAFEARGGKVIFIRMPVSKERWEVENQNFPVDTYWKPFMKDNGFKHIHFADYESLSQFDLPDTSHLDQDDRAEFTHLLLNEVEKTW